jgi:hypothetical protein
MGCKNGVCQSPDESFKHNEELPIRNWEKTLGFYKMDFFDVISELNAGTYLDGSQYVNSEKLKKILKNFINNEDFWKLFDNDTLFKDQGKFSIPQIEILILLITLDKSKSNQTFSDKINYITKNNNDEENVKEEEFKRILRTCVEIACKFLPINYTRLTKDSYNYKIFEDILDEITNKYYTIIFQNTSNMATYLELKQNTKNPSVN